MSKVRFLFIFLLMLNACTQPVKQEVQALYPEKKLLDGIWEGSFDIRGRGPYDFQVIHVGDRSTAVSHKAKAMCVGKVTLDKDEFYLARYNLYALDGSPFDYATITGVLEGGTIDAHFRTLNGGDTGAIKISYSKLYEQPSSLDLVQGDWKFVDRDGLKFEISIEDNVIRGTDSDSCKYLGQVNIINPKYNAYNIELNISNCDSVNGKYEGLSYLDNLQDTYLRIDVGNEHYGFHYDFQRPQSADA